jgi:predicted unusual protein kinase regulating ubiquinone biosynthesis (AarF/ABC1/UbiB family)
LAVESKNTRALAILKSKNIDPKVLGTQIMQLGMWGRLECPFFHADPHPGNILIRPNNEIVLLDFGACGGVSSEMVSHQIEMSRRLVNDDIAGGTAITIAMLAPLPNIDANEIHRVLKEVMWNFQITVRSKDAQWWERTSAALWVWTLEAVRRFNLPVNIDVLLFVRATLLYDTLACRLNPEVNVENSFRLWRKGFRKRCVRRMRQQPSPFADRTLRDNAALEESLKKTAYFLCQFSRQLPQQFNAATSKEAYVASSLLKLGSGIAVIFTVCLLIASFYASFTAENLSQELVIDLLLSYPVLFVLVIVMAWHNLSNILRRLNELDPNEA